MATFETVPLEEAIEATRVVTWLEEQFGEEYECNLDRDECPECGYAPLLDSFNYCPMCVLVLRRIEKESN